MNKIKIEFLIILIVSILVYSEAYAQQVFDTLNPEALWKWYDSIMDASYRVSRKDSSEAYKELVSGVRKENNAIDLLNKYNEAQKKNQKPKTSISEIIKLLEEGRSNFEKSLRLNPKDQRTTQWLVSVYQRLQTLYKNENNLSKSLEMLKPLAIIYKDDHRIFYQLGENYFALNNWHNAYNNFNKAIENLLDTAWTDIDTTSLFYYLFYRTNTEIKLNLPFKALISLEYSLQICPNDEYRKRISDLTDWINWDDGNLKASAMYDSLRKLEREKKFAEAHYGYSQLLPQLSTERAKNDVNLEMAKLSFYFLENTKEGIELLHNLINKIPIDDYGAAIDSSYNKFLNNFARMCYMLGVNHLEKKNYKLAYIYFSQAASINWSERGKSYLQLARLSLLDVWQTIQNCQQALKYSSSLNNSELRQLYRYLYTAYRQTGKFDDAQKWYLDYYRQ